MCLPHQKLCCFLGWRAHSSSWEDREEEFSYGQAATPKFEVKRHGASGPSNDCMPVPPGSYSASNFAGAAILPGGIAMELTDSLKSLCMETAKGLKGSG